MKMKLVRVKRKDADWKSYKDPLAVLQKDLDSFVKLCKEAKKKVDILMNKGEWLQLDKANEFFTRAVIASREVEQEFMDAKVWCVNEYEGTDGQKVFDNILDIQKNFNQENKKLKDVTTSLDVVGKRLSELKPIFSTVRKTVF